MAKVSTSGYKRTSKDKNEPALVIPSNNITMKGVDFPVLGTDNTGYSQMMYPGMEYVFPGNQVFEIPMKQSGGDISIPSLRPTSWLSKYQDGGDMPFGLPLRSVNPGSPWAYESPQANGYLLPDPNRPELLNTGATEYKMEADGVTIPTVVNGQYMEPDQAYQRYMLTGEKFKSMIDPHSYSAFYNTVGPLGLMKQKKGGSPSKNQYINDVTLSNTSSWLDKYK